LQIPRPLHLCLNSMVKRLVLLSMVLIAALTVSAVQAAPSLQEEPTATPLPPPGGGRVVVDNLIIRAGASIEWRAIGVLTYGEEVFPVGRSFDGEWAIIEINTAGDLGWLAQQYIEWSPDFNFQALPVIVPGPTPSATPSLTPSPSPTEAATTAVQASPPAAPSKTPAPTASETPLPPTSTATPALAVVAPTRLPTVAPTALPGPAPTVQAGSTPIWVWLGGGLLLVLALYFWRWLAARRELRRYAEGFVLDACPVCQIGGLNIDRHVSYQLGVPTVRRIVRCDHCNSIIRQMRSGVWRYAVDPHANPELAANHDDMQPMTDSDLQDFSVHARRYTPDVLPVTLAPDDRSVEFESAMEHLEALEADVIAAREQEVEQEESGPSPEGPPSEEESSE